MNKLSPADQYNSIIPSYMLETAMEYYSKLSNSCSTNKKVKQLINEQMVILRSFERPLLDQHRGIEQRQNNASASEVQSLALTARDADRLEDREIHRFSLEDAAQPPVIKRTPNPALDGSPIQARRIPASDSVATFPAPASRKVWGYRDPPRGALQQLLPADHDVVLLYSTERGTVNGGNAIAQTCFENMEKIDTFYRKVFLENPVQRKDDPQLMEAFLHVPQEDAWWSAHDHAVHLGPSPLNKRNVDTNLGVIAHEFGHAFVQYSANFKSANGIEANESGALNESCADIFAIMVKHYQTRTLASSPDADWRIGEDCLVRVSDGEHFPLRLMDNPGHAFTNWTKIPGDLTERLRNNDCQPADMAAYEALKAEMVGERLLGPDVPTDQHGKQIPYDNGGVHFFSSIPSRAFTLASKAIGDYTYGKPGQVWHEALMHAQRENIKDKKARCIDNFSRFAIRTLEACKGLHYHQGVYNAIGQAWQTVGVDLKPKYPAVIRQTGKVLRGKDPDMIRGGIGVYSYLFPPSIRRHKPIENSHSIKRLEVFQLSNYDDRETIVRELEAGRQVAVVPGDSDIYIQRGNKQTFRWHQKPLPEAAPFSAEKIAAIKNLKKPFGFRDLSAEFRSDRDVTLDAVHCFGGNLDYAIDALKNDRAIVLTAVQSYSMALEHASDALKNDKEIVLAAVECDGDALRYASDERKKDKIVVLTAVQSDNGCLGVRSYSPLRFASNNLKNDKEIVLAAVQNDGNALQYASNNLKKDKEIVLAAVQNDGDALQYASNKLKNDKEIVLAAVQKYSRALRHAGDLCKDDKNIVLAALQRFRHKEYDVRFFMHYTITPFNYVSSRLKTDPEVNQFRPFIVRDGGFCVIA